MSAEFERVEGLQGEVSMIKSSTRRCAVVVAWRAAVVRCGDLCGFGCRLADQARDAGWTHEDDLAAVLEREVAARNASGAELRIRAAGFPPRKTLVDWDHQLAVRQQVAALATGAFLTEARNVVLLGPPGTGKTHLATGLGIIAASTPSSRPGPRPARA
jgi:hypothetical protein